MHFFLAKKAERENLQQLETQKAKSLFRTELEWLSRSPKARTSKSKSRIDAALELGEKARNKPVQGEVKLQVMGRRIGGKVLEIKNLRKAYGEITILDNFTYTFKRQRQNRYCRPEWSWQNHLSEADYGRRRSRCRKNKDGRNHCARILSAGWLSF